MSRIETSESLTLNVVARVRATKALQEAFEYGHRPHTCSDWNEGDGCTICWQIAADVIRAAEGFALCQRCNGGGMVAPGDSCPECGGDGLEATA